MSTISTYLNEHSKFSNSSSKFGSFSINSIELNGDLQLTLDHLANFSHKNQFL
jgi:hypothetical protein